MLQDKDFENQNANQDISFTEINLKDTGDYSERFGREETESAFPFGKIPADDFSADDLYSDSREEDTFPKTEEKPKKEPLMKGIKIELPQIIGLVLTLCWSAVAIQYMIQTNWWQTRFSISPTEFIGFFSGMFLPIILIWLIIGYFEKTSNLKRQVMLLEKYFI